MAALVAVFAVLVALIGVVFLSEATTGVGAIAFACLLAIFARMAQASDHHRDRIRRESARPPTT